MNYNRGNLSPTTTAMDLLRSPQSEPDLRDGFSPRLLVESEPAHRVFLRNLRDVVFPRRTRHELKATEGLALWSDVFVASGLPWWRFVESFAIHALVIAALWSASRAWLLRPQAVPLTAFSKRDVIYFPASEYLQPLDTGSSAPRTPQKGEPEFSKNAILSVPPEADNHRQTVVTPPDIKLRNDVPLPNVVAWNSVDPAAPINAVSRLQLPAQQPTAIIAPPPTVENALDRRRLDAPENAAIAPPPEVSAGLSVHVTVTPQAAVIEPPPSVQGHIRNVGDINIGHADVVPPAPQLPTREQRSVGYAASSGNLALGVVPPPPNAGSAGVAGLRSGGVARLSSEVVPPPPSVAGSDRSKNRIVALGLYPTAGAPPVASGNRRGTFASSPNGKPGAAGTPEIKANDRLRSSRDGNGGSSSRTELPPGLVVKPNADPLSVAGSGENPNNTLLAEAKPPLRVGTAPRRALANTLEPTAEEREVFGNRKFYSMTLNMPNLNSAGGSWVIRFAELKDNTGQGDLMAPEATRKVDPAYPLELMRTQIEGKVTLYAVIHSDGSVGDVRVLNSVDERLDEFARAALSRWRFRPASKAGNPVALQAVVTIPFRSRRVF